MNINQQIELEALNIYSDALDASRDVILADAAHALGLYHQFYEDNLCIYPQGFEVDWEQFFLDREER